MVCIIPDIFPGIEGLKPLGDPGDIKPPILDESVIDYKINVSAEDAYSFCHQLAQEGIFAGQSSGAYLKGVAEVAKTEKRGRCITLLNDFGERYFSMGLWK